MKLSHSVVSRKRGQSMRQKWSKHVSMLIWIYISHCASQRTHSHQILTDIYVPYFFRKRTHQYDISTFPTVLLSPCWKGVELSLVSTRVAQDSIQSQVITINLLRLSRRWHFDEIIRKYNKSMTFLNDVNVQRIRISFRPSNKQSILQIFTMT